MPIAVTMKIQPMEFRGPLEMIRAPTAANGVKERSSTASETTELGPSPRSVCRLSTTRTSPNAVMARSTTNSETAMRPAVRSCMGPLQADSAWSEGVEESGGIPDAERRFRNLDILLAEVKSSDLSDYRRRPRHPGAREAVR